MNTAVISGNLTKDPECKYTTGNPPKPMAKFTVAINRRSGGEDRADFINVVCFNEKTVEYIKEYIHKGDTVGVTGRIQTGSFENKEGIRVNTFDIVANSIEKLRSPRPSEGSPAQGGYQHQGGYQQQPMQQAPPAGYQQMGGDIPY